MADEQPYDYPIIALDRFGDFRFFREPKDFYSLDRASLAKGLWAGMRLLDSSGVGRKIVSVTPMEIVGGWYGRLLNQFGMNVFHWVLLDIVEGIPLALEDAKAQVAARFEASMGPGLRAELSDGEERVSLLKAAILSATTVGEIASNFDAVVAEIDADVKAGRRPA